MSDSLFSAVCKSAPVGLMILNADARVVHLNAFLKSMLSLPSDGCKGRLFGNALNCSSISGTGQKCGDTPTCVNCRLRHGIAGALVHNRPARYTVLTHTFIVDGIPAAKTLRLSAVAIDTKQGRCAIISFADITREKQYEWLLARNLDLEPVPTDINPQNLIGIVAGLMQKAGADCSIAIGIAKLEGLRRPNIRGGMSEDETLRRFIEIARQCTRRQDIICRNGESSFLFMFPGAGIHMASVITRRIHNTMTAVFASYGAGDISFSAGFTELNAAQLTTTTGEEIIRAVDGYLQKARYRGGSLFVSNELTESLKG